MKICGLQKLTLLDFPTKTACTVFTGGCNLRCPFCHNAPLVTGVADAEALDVEEFFAFLAKRKGLLQGVCISGGEPLLQPDIADFIRRIRTMGYAVKLDTNGTLPDRLKPLLDEGLLDYVAMDLKNAPNLYGKTVGIEGFDFAPVAQSMALLRASGIPYEYRTTVVRPLHTVEGLKKLSTLINKDEKWFLQQYTDGGEQINPTGLSSYSDGTMKALAEELRSDVPLVANRGI